MGWTNGVSRHMFAPSFGTKRGKWRVRRMEFGIFPVFRGLDGKLQVQHRIPFPSEEDAMRAGEVFAGVLGGAVAYSRVTDTETGTAEDGVIIGRFGVMAEDATSETMAGLDLPSAAE
jgi:hypothetical protein